MTSFRGLLRESSRGKNERADGSPRAQVEMGLLCENCTEVRTMEKLTPEKLRRVCPLEVIPCATSALSLIHI